MFIVSYSKSKWIIQVSGVTQPSRLHKREVATHLTMRLTSTDYGRVVQASQATMGLTSADYASCTVVVKVS
jgi:hypothetical protein